MRKRIRLTGRKQLARSVVEVKVVEIGGKKLVAMTIANKSAFAQMPDTARIRLRLFENKFSETLEFGTLGDMKTTAEIRNTAFSGAGLPAAYCCLRRRTQGTTARKYRHLDAPDRRGRRGRNGQ